MKFVGDCMSRRWWAIARIGIEGARSRDAARRQGSEGGAEPPNLQRAEHHIGARGLVQDQDRPDVLEVGLRSTGALTLRTILRELPLRRIGALLRAACVLPCVTQAHHRGYGQRAVDDHARPLSNRPGVHDPQGKNQARAPAQEGRPSKARNRNPTCPGMFRRSPADIERPCPTRATTDTYPRRRRGPDRAPGGSASTNCRGRGREATPTLLPGEPPTARHLPNPTPSRAPCAQMFGPLVDRARMRDSERMVAHPLHLARMIETRVP